MKNIDYSKDGEQENITSNIAGLDRSNMLGKGKGKVYGVGWVVIKLHEMKDSYSSTTESAMMQGIK